MEDNKEKNVSTGDTTMFELHAKICKLHGYDVGSSQYSNIFEEYHKYIDKINIDFCNEAMIYLKAMFPEIITDMKLQKAVVFGVSAHINRNLRYGKKPYFVHLSIAYTFAKKYGFILERLGFTDEQILSVFQAIWLHDTIEDCAITYNDVLKNFNKDVAEIVFLLSNNRGRTREERADENYYNEMSEEVGAVFGKLCDRLANVSYSSNSGSDMYHRYGKENKHFTESLGVANKFIFREMFEEIEEMLEEANID